MTPGADAWVFDTGPLRHFALSGWLGVLKFLAGSRPVLMPDVVERELRRQTEDVRAVGQVLDADWIHVFSSSDPLYMANFAKYARRLVADGKNEGECGVLAMGATFGSEMVIDDSTPERNRRDGGLAGHGDRSDSVRCDSCQTTDTFDGGTHGGRTPCERVLPALRSRRVSSARSRTRAVGLRRDDLTLTSQGAVGWVVPGCSRGSDQLATREPKFQTGSPGRVRGPRRR